MKRSLIFLVLIVVVLAGCALDTATPTLSPTSTQTRTPKPTSQYMIYTVTKGTGLYDACGDADANILAELSEGTKLYAFGKAKTLDCCKFVDSGMDFELCHMEVVSTGKTGWVLKKWFK